MADTHPRRNRREVAKRRLSPLQKRIALPIALELQQRIGIKSPGGAELIHLDRMVDHQFGRHQRIHALRVAAQRPDGVAHRGKIHHCGHAGKVLHQHPRRHVGNLPAGLGLGVPVGQKLNVPGRHIHAILAAQQVFKQNLQAERQLAQVESARFEGGKPIHCVRPIAGGQRAPAVKAVHNGTTFLSAHPRTDLKKSHCEPPSDGDSTGHLGAQSEAVPKNSQQKRLLRGENAVHGRAGRGESASAPASMRFGLRNG